MNGSHWFFDERTAPGDFAVEDCIPEIAPGDTATPIALPVTRGDRIEIHYPEELDADIRIRDNPEVWHYGGMAKDSVTLHSERAHGAAMDGDFYDPNGRTREGIYRFNKRVLVHAEKVCVEHVEIPRLGHNDD